MNRKVDWQGLDFAIELLDIQQLNNRLFEGAGMSRKLVFMQLTADRQHGRLTFGFSTWLWCWAATPRGENRQCPQPLRATHFVSRATHHSESFI